MQKTLAEIMNDDEKDAIFMIVRVAMARKLFPQGMADSDDMEHNDIISESVVESMMLTKC